MQIQNICLLAVFIAIFSSHTTSAARFNFEHFDGSNLVFLGDAELGSTTDGSSLSGALSMTRDSSPFSHGQGIYIGDGGEIPFKPSNTSSTTYSFKTSFTFSISPRRKTNPNPGHGLAFIVVPTFDNDGAAGKGFLGLLNQTNNGNPNNHVFAVEFDVYQDKDLGDINDNHVGIDINSVKSTVSEKAGYWVQTRTVEGKKVWEFIELKLSSGDKYKSWVEYDNVSKLVTVTIAPAYLSKPKKPLIETPIDLSKVFLGKMFTGFAGSMGREVERHDIWTWRFENNAPKEIKPVQSG
ncbi:Lectin-like protein [Raphanus sativus]|uniref:Lectin-like protein At1g53080 n=1 Tax=Raphanus sativus TaxID=3726 RepID=A0A9W3DU79_RAPSA|nr:lectin-like protein At1g53080 [Raphanus sativus]KAJ4896830.1 Lectin-like protein [Raphanus sativus]